MQFDLNALKRQYEQLSDTALLAISRDELVEAARQEYDRELLSRGLSLESQAAEDDAGEEVDLPATSDTGEWEGEPVLIGRFGLASEVAEAIEKLEDAGIPTHLERAEAGQDARRAFSLYAPAAQAEQAKRILFDEETSEDYQTHFSEISDEELLAIDSSTLPEVARALYAEERSKRGFESTGIIESPVAPANPEGTECVGTFVSRAQATYAQSLLEAGGIGSHLIDGSAEEDALDEAQVSLWAPSADYDLACQLLESRVEDILTHSA